MEPSSTKHINAIFIWSLVTKQHKASVYAVGCSGFTQARKQEGWPVFQALLIYLISASIRKVLFSHSSPFVKLRYFYLLWWLRKGEKENVCSRHWIPIRNGKVFFLRRNRRSRVFCFYLLWYLYNQLARLEVMACCFCDRLACLRLKLYEKWLLLQVLTLLSSSHGWQRSVSTFVIPTPYLSLQPPDALFWLQGSYCVRQK